jgi:hypothetical protein
MTVRDSTLELIRLAERRNTEDDVADDRSDGSIGYSIASEAVKRLAAGPRPCTLTLHEYLRSLPPDVLFKIRTLMYVGRGDATDVLDFHADLAGDDEDTQPAIFSIAGKSPLPRYLKRGIELADAASVDLEAPWHATEARASPAQESDKTSQFAQPHRRAFPEGQDPYVNGATIFHEIANTWNGDSITDPQEMQRFFNLLQLRTDGRVIVDFIDLASWDQIDGHLFDPETRYLELYWHDYRGVDSTTGRPEPENLFLPASLYGLLIKLREIHIVRAPGLAAFLLSGHTLDRSEIKGRLAPGSSDQKAIRDSHFSSRFLRSVNGQVHIFDVLTSPLYTAAILPKDPRLETSFSRVVLLLTNLARVQRSLRRAADALARIDQKDTDAICEKVNTIRRNWEQALKIEIILHGIKPTDSYNALLLGDLLALLKDFDGNLIGEHPGRLIGWANELSHDAGTAIELEEASAIARHVSAYVDRLLSRILPTPVSAARD